jgi:hypothetical protein
MSPEPEILKALLGAELTQDQHLQLIQTLANAGLLKAYWFPKL